MIAPQWWQFIGDGNAFWRVMLLLAPNCPQSLRFHLALRIAAVDFHPDLQDIDKGVVGFQHTTNGQEVDLHSPGKNPLV